MSKLSNQNSISMNGKKGVIEYACGEVRSFGPETIALIEAAERRFDVLQAEQRSNLEAKLGAYKPVTASQIEWAKELQLYFAGLDNELKNLKS